MECIAQSIPDIVLIRPKVFTDDRGYFFESWQSRRFSAAGIDAVFVQDNHSHSARNTLRGLHYQINRPQGKLIRVVRGTVFDVAVDLRKHSATFGRWVGTELSEHSHHSLWIPPGFAHGYLTLSEHADLLYRCTDYWSVADERAIRWNDPELRIEWPLPSTLSPLLSEKDRAAGLLKNAELYP